MIRRALAALGLGTALGVGATSSAGAQTCDAVGYRPAAGSCSVGPIPVSVTIGKVADVTLSAATTTLPPPTSADLDAGFVAASGPSVVVQANTPWSLQIGSATATWTAAAIAPNQAARPDKPASDLLWATAAGGTLRAMSVTTAPVRSGGATAGTTTPLFYRVLLAWDADAPGDYSLVVSLTIVTP